MSSPPRPEPSASTGSASSVRKGDAVRPDIRQTQTAPTPSLGDRSAGSLVSSDQMEGSAMDQGLQFVQRVRQELGVEQEWSIPTKRGFAWWAHTLRQDVFVQPVLEGDGFAVNRLVIRTQVLGAPSVDLATTDGVLARRNGATTGGAFRREPDGSIVHELSTWVGPGTPWVADLVAPLAILALRSCERAAEELARELGTPVKRSSHPRGGVRKHPNPRLLAVEDDVETAGRGGTRWDDPDPFGMAAIDLNTGSGFAADVSGEGGVVCEFGFGAQRTTFCALMPTAEPPESPAPGLPGNGPDPRFGHGLIAWLLLPMEQERHEAEGLAAVLNAAETAAPDDFMAGWLHFGAWTVWNPDGQPTIAYRLFVPNLLAGLVSVDIVVSSLGFRAEHASRLLCPDEEPRSGADIATVRAAQYEEAFGDAPENSPDRLN